MRKRISISILLVSLLLFTAGYFVTFRDESCAWMAVPEDVELVGEGAYTVGHTYMPAASICSWLVEGGVLHETRSFNAIGTSLLTLGTVALAAGLVSTVTAVLTAGKTNEKK